ncbi:MAG TPA: hypothetical protein VMV68_03345 [Spirochaetia bacterium]|nr:hypothetical protein [Spirochaetia bacterium]
MRRLIRISVLALFLSVPAAVFAQAHNVAVGIILGQPTGISAKLWLDRTSAFDLAAAWQFLPAGSLYVHADYLYHIYHVFPIKEGELPLYFGIGGSATIQSVPTIGLRIPFGIEYLFPKAPLDVFLEIGIGISLFPATAVQGSGGVGIRYEF